MSKATCPACGAAAIRAGALKCPSCRAWIGPRPAKASRPLLAGIVGAALAAAGAAAGGAAVGLAGGGPNAAPAADGAGSSERARESAAASTPAHAAAAASTEPASASAAVPEAPSSRGASAAPPPRPPPPPPGAGGPGGGEAPPPPAGVAAPGAHEPAAWSAARAVRIAAAPLDAVVSDDGATVYVLGEDATVRAHAAGGGPELRKIAIPGKGTSLRWLGADHLAVLGVPGATLPVLDTAAWTIAQLDIGGAPTDVALVGNGERLIAATGPGRRVSRFAVAGWKPEGQVLLPRPVVGLMAGQSGGRETLAVLTQGLRPGELGSIDVLEPLAAPFGGARVSWSAGVDPRPGRAAGGEGFLAVDRSSSQLLHLSSSGLAVVNVGQQPIGAFALAGGYAVTVDGAGTATIVSLVTHEVKGSIALGAVPTDAAATADGRALLVALGGGPREHGATTAVITGDPPTLAARIDTGPGSLAVAVGRSDRIAVVTSYWTKAITVLTRTR